MLSYIENWCFSNSSLVMFILSIGPMAITMIVSNVMLSRAQKEASSVQRETNQIKQEEIQSQRERTNIESKIKLRQMYLSHILPQQNRFISELDSVADLPIKNNPDYLKLRLEPVGTIKFDKHQPLVHDEAPPTDNALYITLYDKIRMMKGEFSYLFPDLVSLYENFWSSVEKLYQETSKLHSHYPKDRMESDEITAWDAAQKAYIRLQDAMIESMSVSISDK